MFRLQFYPTIRIDAELKNLKVNLKVLVSTICCVPIKLSFQDNENFRDLST